MRSLVVAATALAVIALAGAAAADEREVAFEVGLPAVRLAADLAAGEEACRSDIEAPAAFERVRFVTGTFGRPGPALRVVVRSRAVRSAARVAGGYPDDGSVEARVGRVPAGGPLEVCVSNEGPGRVALFGTPPDTPPDHLLDPGRRPLPAVVFVREPPDSMLSLVPTAFERSGLFKPGAPWLFWILLAVMALAVPAALVKALGSASELLGDARGGAVEHAPAEDEHGDGDPDRDQQPDRSSRRRRR